MYIISQFNGISKMLSFIIYCVNNYVPTTMNVMLISKLHSDVDAIFPQVLKIFVKKYVSSGDNLEF